MSSKSLLISRFAAELATAGSAAAFGTLISYGALDSGIHWASDGPAPGYLPFYVGLIITIAGLAIVTRTLLQRSVHERPFIEDAAALRVFGFFALAVSFVVVAYLLGMYVATVIYLLVATRVYSTSRWWAVAAFATFVPALLFLLFEILLRAPLNKGPIERFFGFY